MAEDEPSPCDVTDLVRRHAIALTATARTGLHYASDPFDRQRYEQVLDIGSELLALISAASKEDLKTIALEEVGHATPKVDVRGAVFDGHGRILLVQERSDRLWTLPGGWADVLESASEAVRREIREEAGLETETVKLAAVLDRERQDNHPPMSAHIYKLFFLCRKTGHTRRDDVEILNVDWYELDALPPLSTSRVTESQLRLMHAHHNDPTRPTTFD